MICSALHIWDSIQCPHYTGCLYFTKLYCFEPERYCFGVEQTFFILIAVPQERGQQNGSEMELFAYCNWTEKKGNWTEKKGN